MKEMRRAKRNLGAAISKVEVVGPSVVERRGSLHLYLGDTFRLYLKTKYGLCFKPKLMGNQLFAPRIEGEENTKPRTVPLEASSRLLFQ